MKSLTIKAAALLLTLGVATTAAAERSVDESRKVAPDARIEVENISGSIELIGWSSSEVRVSGTIADDVEEVRIEGDEASLSIEVALPKRSNDGWARLTIYVPSGGDVDVSTVSADIVASDLQGSVELRSVSGDIRLSGNVREVDVATVSGDVDVKDDGVVGNGRFKTVSGDVDYSGGIDVGGRFRFESMSGDVTLRLPEGTGADIEMKTFSGDIRGVDHVDKSEHGPGANAEMSIGGGGARVTVKTFSGDLTIR